MRFRNIGLLFVPSVVVPGSDVKRKGGKGGAQKRNAINLLTATWHHCSGVFFFKWLSCWQSVGAETSCFDF